MCQLCNINPEQAEAFAGGLLETFNKASLSTMISVGHRSALFDKMADMGPAGYEEIAAEAALNSRYVKEWLAAMVTGRIVSYDPEQKEYHLPAEHAAFLTRAAGPDNFATLFQFIPVLAGVEDKLLECFENGGGVPYEKFHRFHEVMAEESGQNFKNNMITKVLPLLDQGIEQLEKGIQVLDIGCGSGTAINTLARVFPKSNFVGIDICEAPLEQAKKDAEALGLTNVGYVVQDAAKVDFKTRFELITTFDAIHDQAHPDRVLKNIYRHLKEGGTYLMVDIEASSNLEENMEHPLAPALYSMSTAHCMTVSLAQGGQGLGTMWGRQKAMEMLKEAGFKKTELKYVEKDIMNAYYISKK
jgi:ubiquinone/menaquinone biosynthesis C-methylase UbiE